MDLVQQNFDINFVKDIYNIISKIKEILPQFLNYFLNLQISKYEEELLNVINNFNQTISVRTNKFSKKEYLKMKQENFEKDLKSKFKNYSEIISKIYENDYIKRMKKYNKKLEYLINNIISESEMKSLSSSSISLNKNTNDESFGEEQNGKSQNFYDNNIFNEDNNIITNNDDNSKSIEINFNCSVCLVENPKKAKIFCDKCNQLFCESCYDIIEKFGKEENKCEHNIQNISKMKEKNEKGKISFLNSLNIFFKRIILKSNYLLNNQNIKFIKNNDVNISRINFIKKKLFEYPIIKDINNIDDSTEINFLNNINNILVNNFEINNIDINSFNIFEIYEDLVRILHNIFMDEKNQKINLGLGIKDLVKEKEDIDDYDESVDEDDITDEKNIIIKPIKQIKNESK